MLALSLIPVCLVLKTKEYFAEEEFLLMGKSWGHVTIPSSSMNDWESSGGVRVIVHILISKFCFMNYLAKYVE